MLWCSAAIVRAVVGADPLHYHRADDVHEVYVAISDYVLVLRSAAVVMACQWAVACGSDDPETVPDSGEDVVADAEQDASVDPDPDDPDAHEDPGVDPDSGEDGEDDDGGDVADLDADADADSPTCESGFTTIDPSPAGVVSEPDGPDPDLPLVDGQARASMRRATPDHAGVTSGCRVGDWVLQNAQIRVCVDGHEPVTTLMFDGGGITDITGPDDPSDSMLLMRPASGLLVAAVDSFELINDGTNGEAAVLQVQGPEVAVRFLAGTIGNAVPAQYLRYTTEYRLPPDAAYIEVVTWLERERPGATVLAASDLVAPGDTALPWYGTFGFSSPGSAQPIEFYAAIGEEHAYGVYSESLSGADFEVPVLKAPLSELVFQRGRLCEGEPGAIRRYYTYGTDTEEIRQHFAPLLPELVSSELTITAARSGRYEVRTAESSVAVVRLEADTPRVIQVPDGDYEIVLASADWSGAGPPPVHAFSVAGPTEVSVDAWPFGTLAVSITTGPAGMPTNLGGAVHLEGPVNRTLMAIDDGEPFELPPGTYAALVNRGEAWSDFETEVVIEDGVTTELSVSLERVLDTPGWISGDLHQHQTSSPDSVVPNEDRIRSNIAAGLDYFAPTDHDSVAEWTGPMEALQVGDRMGLLVGTEISPGVGHMNAFPWGFEPDLASNGGLGLGFRHPNSRDFEIYSTGALADQAWDRGTQLLQINHARGFALAMFNSAGFDPVVDPSLNESPNFPDTFNAIEVFNESDLGMSCKLIRDLHGLLRFGWSVIATGSSDSHSLTKWVGYPRTYVHLGETDPEVYETQDILDGLTGQRVSVSGGVFMDYTDGTLPGDLLDATAGTVDLQLRVQSPTWSLVDEIVVFQNGMEVERIQLDAVVEDVVDYTGTITLSVTEDAFVTILAHGATPMGRSGNGDLPFGFLNPVYLDFDGDGMCTPPAVSGEDDLDFVTDIAFCE